MVTLIPGTMERLKQDKHFGLASADKDGRARALDFARSACRAIEGLPVAAVEVHSAPSLGGTGAKSSLEAFADSLSQLRLLDWGAAELLVEHCDAAIPGQAAEKGFLRLEDECAAIMLSEGPTRARMMLNWARSAIEARARQAGLLGGLFFSGCTREHADYGTWKDSHAPFSVSCPASLLTPEAAKSALQEAGRVDHLGVKLQPLPASLGTAERLAMIRAAVEAVSAAAAC